MVVNQVPNFTFYQYLNLLNQVEQIALVNIANEEKVNDLAVIAFGKIPDKEHSLYIAKPLNDGLNNLVEAKRLQQNIVDFLEKRMVGIGTEHFFVAVIKGIEHARFLQPVKLQADCIGGFPKLDLQATKVGGSVAVQKELQQQLNTSL
jgi:hypothetical protein